MTGYLKEVARIREKITSKEIQDQLLKDYGQFCKNIGKKYNKKQWYHSRNYQRAKYDREEYEQQAWLEVLELINKGITDKELIKKEAGEKVRTQWRNDKKSENSLSIDKIKDEFREKKFDEWLYKNGAYQTIESNDMDYKNALDSLTLKQKEVRKLRTQGFTLKEIGEKLNKSKQAVAKIDQKAIQKIAEYMTK